MYKASVVSRIAHETFLHSPRILPDGPWWQYLESNFHKRPEGFELEFRDWIRVNMTAWSDVLIRTLGAALLGSVSLPTGYNPLKIKDFSSDKAFYEEIADKGDPKLFFKNPPRDVPISRKVIRYPHLRAKDGIWERLTFDSPFIPVNPRVRDSYVKFRANKKAHAHYWYHLDGPRPTVCAIHGYFADPFWFNEWYLTLPLFFEAGCDVLLFTLPFHGPRQGFLAPFSGSRIFSGGLSQINEAFAQAVYDFRILMHYLEDDRGVTDIGVTGISLGGYTAALLAAVEERLKFSIANVPVVSIPDLVMEYFPLNFLVQTLLFFLKWSIKDMRHFLAVHCPLTYRPLIPKERRMIIGGVGDRLAPPKHSRLLWDHWNRSRIHWFPGSHLLHLDKGMYLNEILTFLQSIGFVDREQSLPVKKQSKIFRFPWRRVPKSLPLRAA